MQSQVVSARDSNMTKAIEELARKVQNLCSEGWRPQGGISIAVKPYGCYACQAMVK